LIHFAQPLSGKDEPMAHFPSAVGYVDRKLSNPILMNYMVGSTP
jgi:hypothetical protein